MIDDGQEHGRGLPPTIPPPEWIDNVTCYSPLLLEDHLALEKSTLTTWTVLKALLIVVSTFLSISLNLIFLITLNASYYSKCLRPQPRFILGTMVANDLVASILVMGLGIFPAVFECWPYGERFCQLQALLRGAFTQQSATILIILALERYIAAVHPLTYNKIFSTKVCYCVITFSWASSFGLYTLVVIPPGGFHFNLHGLMICEPYYLSSNVLIVAACIFYFPTTMVLMYCYGTIFHASKSSLVSTRKLGQQHHYDLTTTATTTNALLNKDGGFRDQTKVTKPNKNGNVNNGDRVSPRNLCDVTHHRNICDITSQSTAAISITFIIVVTPWAIHKVITSCTRTFAPPTVEFTVAWLAGSHRIWSPLIYWIFNAKFRRAVQRFFITKIKCRPLPRDWASSDEAYINGGQVEVDTNQQQDWIAQVEADFSSRSNPASSPPVASMSPQPSNIVTVHPGHLPGHHAGGNSSSGSDTKKQRTAIIQMNEVATREKYWGEILERTLSSQNLIQMHQRISRHELADSSGVSGVRRMKKNLSGSTPQLVHHGVAALKYNDAAEMSRRAIVAKYLSPPPAALAALGKDKVDKPKDADTDSDGKIRRRCYHRIPPIKTLNHINGKKNHSGSSQGGNGSSGSGSSASRKPMGIQGATSLYSLRSLSKEEERSGAKISSKGRGSATSKTRAAVQRGASLDNEYSEYEEVDNRKCNHGTKNRKSDLAEDSDGLWGDDEDDDDVNDVKE